MPRDDELVTMKNHKVYCFFLNHYTSVENLTTPIFLFRKFTVKMMGSKVLTEMVSKRIISMEWGEGGRERRGGGERGGGGMGPGKGLIVASLSDKIIGAACADTFFLILMRNPRQN